MLTATSITVIVVHIISHAFIFRQFVELGRKYFEIAKPFHNLMIILSPCS